MDPWYTYNRLANASASFPAGSEAGSSDYTHQLSGQVGSATAGIPSTTSQLLLQAHSTSLTSTPFSPAGFLTPPAVGYDSVFSPIFHHANSKTSHFNQHRALASTVTPGKQPSEADLSSVRENYVSSHSQSLTPGSSSYFDHQTSSTSQTSTLPWPQGNSQLPSPFGILPHESVVPPTPGAVSSKTSDYAFHAFAVAQQSLASHVGVDYKNSSYSSDGKKTGSLQSSQASSNKAAATTTANTPPSGAFFQPASGNFSSSSSSISSGFTPSKSHQLSPTQYTSTSKPYSSGTSTGVQQQQQSCIVSSGSTSASKDYSIGQSPRTSSSSLYSSSRSSNEKSCSRSSDFVPPGKPHPPSSQSNQPSIQTKAQAKVYPDLSSEQQKNSLESSQSSPISFAMMDSAAGHRYPANVPSPSKAESQSARNGSQFPSHILNPQSSSYRHYPNSGESAETESYATSSKAQNGPDAITRRASPQASPLATHVASPYPIYNSPLPSISSPSSLQSEQSNQCQTASSYKSVDSQVAPPSPLDVSVTRNETSQYPSVIRSLSTPEPSGKTSLFSSEYAQQKPCWDPSQPRSGKYYPATDASLVNSSAQRQYLDPASTHQSALQDLSSCRGDPMSIVKNLQQQLTPQSASDDAKLAKRRRSSDKSNDPPDYLSSRVPPPAHHNTSQQQQNGVYYDWNRPFGGTPNMSHPSYFPPFHLPSHPPSNEYPTVETSQYGGATYQAAAPPALAAQPEVEENPKVIVPDIEDELKFLSEDAPPVSTTDETERKPFAAANPSNDFMASYLKFLQGEPDAPSPPSSKNNRKQAWPKTKVYQPPTPNPSNGGTPATESKSKESPDYDPQDDPRYFPLPKTRDKRKCPDSDSDSDSGFVGRTQVESQNEDKKSSDSKSGVKKEKGRRGRPRIHPPKPPKKPKPENPDPLLLPPRRETSRRKAKEKIILQEQENLDDFEIEVPDHGDSDSDPAWTPVNVIKKSSDDESGRRRSGRKGSTGRKKAKGSGDDGSSGEEGRGTPRNNRNNGGGKGRRPRIRKTGSRGNSMSGDNDGDGSGDDFSDMFPFKSGEFVVIKTDLHEEWPPIWRVDGKTLLQKYEPFEHDGEMLYRNISTYSGWSSDSKHIYRPIAVRFRLQNKSETLVEFLKDEMVEEDEEIVEKLMKETEVYQDNFEVYIQTLISQALDSNFLTEIFQEQDEYFLSNVKKVDDITEERRQRFLSVTKWNSKLEGSVATWPCYNIMAELSVDEVKKNCAACEKPKVSARVIMYGQPYNSTTLEGSQPDPSVASDKDFLMCRLCAGRVELYNKVVHQKYLMFIECAKRVSEKRAADRSKDTTAILNDMLADETWLNELFRKVRTSWAEIDRMERYAQMKNKKATTED